MPGYGKGLSCAMKVPEVKRGDKGMRRLLLIGEFVKQTGFLWKLITYERKDDASSDFRFLWRFIRNSKTKDSSVFEFNPFFYQESEEGKGSYWAILGGLIGQEVTMEGERKMRWLWIF